MDLIIQPFIFSDLPTLAAIFRSAFNETYDDQGWSVEGSEEYFREELWRYTFNRAAKIDDEIVGFISANKHAGMLYIDRIAVSPKHAGKGIGKALYAEALKYCKAQGLTSMVMTADPKSKAFEWYKKLGFYETGWVELWKDI